MLTLMFTLLLGDDVGVEMAPKILARKWRNAHYNSPGLASDFYGISIINVGRWRRRENGARNIITENGKMCTRIDPVLASDFTLRHAFTLTLMS